MIGMKNCFSFQNFQSHLYIQNWFYPYDKWGISTADTFSFDVVKKGSDLIIDEFPNYKDIIKTKEVIEKI